MRSLDCNVLVVGAGPAGSCAAREAAAAGANVLVLERRPVIGVPVQCAEYIPAPLVGEAGVGRGYIVQYVAGMRTMLNGEPIQELSAPGCMIRRDQFDQALAQAAREVGARYLLDTSAIAFDGRMLTARRRGGEIITIQADVVIGADGPHSRVGRWIGSANANCVPAAQMRVRLTKPLQYTEVFFDDRIYGGYAWLFPRGDEANLGLGMLRRDANAPKLGAVLYELLQELADQGRIERTPVGTSGGWIPAEAPRSIVRERVLLAGDAAGHTHPVTGAGVFQAVMGGKMAGKWAARAALTGDLTLLDRYEAEWNEFYGDALERGFARRQLLESHPGKLEDIIRRCWIGFREYYGEA